MQFDVPPTKEKLLELAGLPAKKNSSFLESLRNKVVKYFVADYEGVANKINADTDLETINQLLVDEFLGHQKENFLTKMTSILDLLDDAPQ